MELADAGRRVPQFLLGEYDAAVLIAFRTVEERVRELAKAGSEELGVNLMKKAFGKDGSLRDQEVLPAEADAQMALFWGPSASSRIPPLTGGFSTRTSPRPLRPFSSPTSWLRILDRV
jgi:hypothetical protein